MPSFQVTYDEGVKVGYKWYDAEKKPVLFPVRIRPVLHDLLVFESEGDAGQESARDLHGDEHRQPRGSRSCGSLCFPARSGCGTSEAAGGLEQSQLNAGESKEVTVDVDPKYLSIFNVEQNGWQLLPGDYGFMVGGSSQRPAAEGNVSLSN